MSKFTLYYYKTKKIVVEDLEKQYIPTNSIEEPFAIRELQCYNPIYNIFFEMTENNFDSIGLNHRYHIQDLNHIIDSQTSKLIDSEMFIKFAPLLDPVKYLIGTYKNQEGLRTLPTYNNNNTHHKLSNENNASYIDNFFCYLSSQLKNHHTFSHGIDYYGSFLGIQKKYKMNLDDDIEYLMQSDFFNKNKGKMYEIEQQEDPFSNFGSRNNKNRLSIHNSSLVSNITIEDINDDNDNNDNSNKKIEENKYQYDCIYEKSCEEFQDDSSNSDINDSSNDSDDNSDDNSDESDSDDDNSDDDNSDDDNSDDDNSDNIDDNSDDDNDDNHVSSDTSSNSNDYETESSEIPIHGYIYDFPVQMICLEKCKGTLDELFLKKKINLESTASALFQVIIILYAYQKAFYFTHNDLHTNNIMYIETDIEFLYYKVGGIYYKVPTYGRIFKIIDFGRAIYRFQGKTFCSDSFAPGGDAYTQYNFEPFFNEKKPRLDPNYSFDLCRLGCSIYDFILDIKEELSDEFTPDPLQELIIRWVKDDHGKNVLYKKNGEERYPNFKLYKMITRTIHDKTPELQLSDPFFKSFKMNMKEEVEYIDIDNLPCYV